MVRTLRRKSPQIDLTPYSGRWVAMVRGRITGVGTSAVEARLASKNQRTKEEPLVVFVLSEDRKREAPCK